VSEYGPASRIVIVGGSIAGLTAARELRAGGFRGALTVVDRDPQSPYRRPEVSKKLLTEDIRGRTRLNWPTELRVELLPASVEALDLPRRTLTLAGRPAAADVPFDGLVIASGARARKPAFGAGAAAGAGRSAGAGDDAGDDGVHWLRGASDAARLRAALAGCRRLCVVGGGLIGLEVAALAVSLGQQAVVVEAAPLPMLALLGAEPAAALLRMLEARGVAFRLGATVTGIARRPGRMAADRTSSVRLASGEDIAADVVLVAVGAVPETGWLAGNGLDLTDGVRCDDHCAVIGAAGVVACGDVASWFNPLLRRQMRVEHWTNAIEQGSYAARRLLGAHPPAGFASLPYFWSDQGDLKLQLLGSSEGHDEVVVLESGAASLLAEYRSEGRLLAVSGINAGPAVMTRRAEIAAAYQQHSLADIGLG
jgi:NADPH-dependent 2,4-dienoyl-CoA reductase/sulfur reductase-like enzyme